jgi:serine/threonine-protein kinase
VTLDASGRLIRFVAVPQDGEAASSPAETDWASLFSAAGLNLGDFDLMDSHRAAPIAHDHDLAWAPRSPGVINPVVAAATMRGAPVFFEVGGESPSIEVVRSALSTGRPPAAEAFAWFVTILVFAVAALMARHNLRREEGDRAGARKLTAFVFAGGFLSGVSQAHHPSAATDEVVLLVSLAGWTSVWASLFWLIYIALEQRVRRLWPHTMITWTRLMSGRLRDPLVGRDLLVGVAIGAALVVPSTFTDEPAPNEFLFAALDSLRSARHFLAVFAIHVVLAPEYAFVGLFCLLIVRALVRHTVVAAILTALLVPLISIDLVQDSLASAVYPLLVGLIGATVALRLGLLAWATALLVQFLLTRLPITLDTSAWYYEPSLLTLLVIGGLAAYGCLVLVQSAPRRTTANMLPT